ncbi:putative beta-lactamase superfamily domain containing protein [Lyophyllum shimeji]|uniref:Beta-lactamase superfamily domain containing protein n=1 Tax=Lyophyllum shimeji TaxID=47721 RepID=A0A9P3PWT3_LYOSH|nr:putative beta-lactamase superfamily domain containing protein [Lyophyllum shimeji]
MLNVAFPDRAFVGPSSQRRRMDPESPSTGTISDVQASTTHGRAGGVQVSATHYTCVSRSQASASDLPLKNFPSVSKAQSRLIPTRKPTWGAVHAGGVHAKDKIKSTWLGHACFLVEMPSRSSNTGDRGARILFDPVFSDRCSPSQWVGPKRYTPPPCAIEDIPEIDAVVISHNHYDHLDTHTIKVLSKRPRMPHFFAPLGNGPWFKDFNSPDSHVHSMD